MFNLPNPGSNPANPFYHRTLEEQRRSVNEAVTVELDFKSDAEGKKAGGTMVRKGVYKMTFKNNDEMNKFMNTHADKLNEESKGDVQRQVKSMDRRAKEKLAKQLNDLDLSGYGDYDARVDNVHKFKPSDLKMAMEMMGINESTPAYRKMMKRYKGSDMEKVFKILDKEGYHMGEQSDTLVRNMLEKFKGDVNKAADFIMKNYGFSKRRDRLNKENVEIHEAKATARNIVKGLGDADGPFTVVAMKRDKVIKQETTKRRDMLPAIISTMRKEVGSGVTIAIEDKKGTIRNTFKEGVQKVFNNLNDYLAEGSE